VPVGTVVATMTIHRDWIGIMKEESPAAFTKTPPFVPRVAFIDGMPLLMKSESVTRWQDLVRFNFLSALNRFYSMGAKTVVLGFDVYSLVSSAKSPKRSSQSDLRTADNCPMSSQLNTTIS
jgi:hypothetical protein